MSLSPRLTYQLNTNLFATECQTRAGIPFMVIHTDDPDSPVIRMSRIQYIMLRPTFKIKYNL